MEIYLNGELRRLENTLSVARLLDEMGMNGRRIAVEINRTIVPRSGYADRLLEPGDRVEIVQAIGGG